MCIIVLIVKDNLVGIATSDNYRALPLKAILKDNLDDIATNDNYRALPWRARHIERQLR